jgi:hypothetical protein
VTDRYRVIATLREVVPWRFTSPQAPRPAWLATATLAGDLRYLVDGRLDMPGSWVVRWPDGSMLVYSHRLFRRTFELLPTTQEHCV